jgi:hypothetical protein
MPTPTYTALATVTLGSSASSVTFSSIPSTYRDLIFVMRAGTSENANNRMRFNGDSGNNYLMVTMQGSGSSATASSNNNLTNIPIDWSAFTTPTVGDTNHIVQIMDYSATDKHKTTLNRANRAAGFVDALACRWANTAAITTIAIIPGGGTWLTGSTFDLYGIKA